jgi:hypothetical protein
MDTSRVQQAWEDTMGQTAELSVCLIASTHHRTVMLSTVLVTMMGKVAQFYFQVCIFKCSDGVGRSGSCQ